MSWRTSPPRVKPPYGVKRLRLCFPQALSRRKLQRDSRFHYLCGYVECDEAYVIAGHKGQPEVVKSKGRQGRRRRLQGKAGRGTLEKERPPVCGMMQRGGQVVINLMANVQQKTIEPFIKDTIVSGALVYTDAYSIYARLQSWGYDHKSVNHGRGEFARDEDGDGLCEVHVNTMEGFWS